MTGRLRMTLAALGLAACTGTIGGGVVGGDGGTGDAGVPVADAACPGVSFQPTPVTPSIALLLDQSGSMTSTFGTTTRYDAMHQALTNPQTGVVTLLQDKVIFGANLYTSHNGGPTCPILTSVPRQLGNRDLIDSLLASNKPDDDTPTGEAIDKIVADFQADPPPTGSPPIILLATDGVPDTCAQPDPNMGEAVAVTAAQHAHAAGISLYILGVGTDVSAPHLQDMANAGVGLPVGGPTNAPYYVANDPADLAQEDPVDHHRGPVVRSDPERPGRPDQGRPGHGHPRRHDPGLRHRLDPEGPDDDPAARRRLRHDAERRRAQGGRQLPLRRRGQLGPSSRRNADGPRPAEVPARPVEPRPDARAARGAGGRGPYGRSAVGAAWAAVGWPPTVGPPITTGAQVETPAPTMT